jgi:hypothetical protein
VQIKKEAHEFNRSNFHPERTHQHGKPYHFGTLGDVVCLARANTQPRLATWLCCLTNHPNHSRSLVLNLVARGKTVATHNNSCLRCYGNLHHTQRLGVPAQRIPTATLEQPCTGLFIYDWHGLSRTSNRLKEEAMKPSFRQQQLDSVLEWILLIPESSATNTVEVNNPFKVALFFSAMRCIFQYVLVPFVLPILGLMDGTPTWLGLVFNLVAFVALVSSLRHIWTARHPRRFSYLPLALLMLFAISISGVSDVLMFFK